MKEVEVRRMGELPIDGGGFGDVWKGHLLLETRLVAIKVPRAINRAHLHKLNRRLAREVAAWATLNHEHVLPLLGVVILLDQPLLLVSPWMENGNLSQYMKTHPDADVLHLLMGVGRGLAHIHANGIVHRELKAANVLVDQKGEPQLMGFGLSSDPGEVILQPGTVRWLAPERLIPENFGLSHAQARSAASDVYALGMIIYEVFSGEIPFYETSNTFSLVLRIEDGVRPSHPGDRARPGLTANIWAFVCKCWDGDRYRRPNAKDLEAALYQAAWEVRMTTKHIQQIPFEESKEISASVKTASLDQAQQILRPHSAKHLETTTYSGVPHLGAREGGVHARLLEFRALLLQMDVKEVRVQRSGGRAIARGGFGEVWQGSLSPSGGLVAIKVPRVTSDATSDKLDRAMAREIAAWSTLHHEHVLPLLGVVIPPNEPEIWFV